MITCDGFIVAFVWNGIHPLLILYHCYSLPFYLQTFLGRIHDFQGPYYVDVDRFMVGGVSKYYRIPTSTPLIMPPGMTRKQAWDKAVKEADLSFSNQVHNICCNNCHHHSADAMQRMGIEMSMLKAWALITFKGKYVSWGQVARVYIPFFILLTLVFVLTYLTGG